ncbi:SPOR domain-containing protein [bacterium]|nr:SPOR domain-containing protein [bacterium]
MMLNRKFHHALIVIISIAFLAAIAGCSSNAQPKKTDPTPDDKIGQETPIDGTSNADGTVGSPDADATGEIPANGDEVSGDAKSDTPRKSPESISEKKPSTGKASVNKKKMPIDKKTLHRVIVGSFDTQSNADKLAKALIDDGFTPYVAKEKVDNKTVFLVQVGAFSSIKNYNKRVKELEAKGYKTVPISGKTTSEKQPDDNEESSDFRF